MLLQVPQELRPPASGDLEPVDVTVELVDVPPVSGAQPDGVTNVALGFAGASLAGWLLAYATSNESEFTLAGICVSFLGAIALLGVANLIRHASVR